MTVSAFAQLTVTGTAPTVSGDNQFAVDTFNGLLGDAFDRVVIELNDMFGEIKYENPEKLIRAFGNSSVYSSHGATNRAYGGYNIFSVSFGAMAGVQLPVSPFDIMNEMDSLAESITEEGDVNFGFSPQFLSAHIGLSTSFLMKNLYLGVRVGYFNLPSLVDGLYFNNFVIGATANYQLIPKISLAGVITWRGINLGTGLILQRSAAGISVPLGGDISEPVDSSVTIKMDPEATLDFAINTVTIPLEAITAIKLVFLNIPFGLGVDLAFGKSTLSYGVDSSIDLVNLESSGFTQATSGNLAVSGGKSMSPSFFNLKLMTGIGFAFGPAYIDIPITYYFMNKGFNIGMTAGVSF